MTEEKHIEELRAKAKAAGIKSWHVKKPETLQKELEALEPTPGPEKKPEPKPEPKPKVSKIQVLISKEDVIFLKSIGFKTEWIESLANQYNFNKFVYMAKFKAFRCYREGKHLDWMSINDFGLLHLKQELTRTKLTFQPLSTKRQVIKLPWRKIEQTKINDPRMQ